jgi:hypothetical protein
MRSVKIVRIVMLVAVFTLPLNAQQPHRESHFPEIARAQGIGMCAAPVHADSPHGVRALRPNDN